MKTQSSFHPLTLTSAFEQFLEGSSFARRTRESYAEYLARLFVKVGQEPVTALTTDVLQIFLARQEALAPTTYNRRLAALRTENKGALMPIFARILVYPLVHSPSTSSRC